MSDGPGGDPPWLPPGDGVSIGGGWLSSAPRVSADTRLGVTMTCAEWEYVVTLLSKVDGGEPTAARIRKALQWAGYVE